MLVSAMLTSLPLDFPAAVRQAAVLGFTHVDVVALADRPPEHLEALADSGLLVSCAAVGRGLPDGQTLDAPTVGPRRAAVETAKRQITDAARLGATHCYVVPGRDTTPDSLLRFAEACGLLAEFAAQRMVKLCVEHAPGRALSTVATAVEWLEKSASDQLHLLLDIGHCLISGEDAAAMVSRAGARIGYIHFDDNDGVNDLHWPLLTGKLTDTSLGAVVRNLREQRYTGALALELSPGNAEPASALRQGKEILERLCL